MAGGSRWHKLSKQDHPDLKENHPDFALVLDVKDGLLMSFSDLTYHEVPVDDLEIGSYILVKAGEVKKAWKDSMLNQIVQLTEEAQQSKPKLQRWLDKFGEQYSKVVIILSATVALMGPVLFKWPFFSTSVCRGSIYRALGLMVAASPCALAVAPLVYATAISACAKKVISSNDLSNDSISLPILGLDSTLWALLA